MKDYTRKEPLKPLRDRIACNLVKAKVLGDAHDPSEAQGTQMADALAGIERPGRAKQLDARTWNSWWAAQHKVQPTNIEWLDGISGQPPGLITSLITGAEFDHPICWHLQALDAASYWGDGKPGWERERERRAGIVLQALHRRWAPRGRQLSQLFPGAKLGDFLTGDACAVHDHLAPTSVVPFLFNLARETHYLNDERRPIWALDLATSVLAGAAMIRHLQTVPLSRMGDYFAITDLMVDVFWEPDPLSMVAEPIAYFGEYNWDMDARLNLDLAGTEYRQLLQRQGVDRERFSALVLSP